MSEQQNNFLKSKKGQFLIFGVVAAALTVGVIVFIVSSFNEMLADPLAKENAANIEFAMELNKNEKEKKDSKGTSIDVDDYVDDINRSGRVVESKEFNFSVGPSQSSEQITTASSKISSTDEQKLNQVNQILGSSIGGSLSKSTEPTSRQYRSTSTPKKSIESETIKNEIEEIYNNGSSKSNRTNSIPVDAMLNNASQRLSKEELEQKELLNRRKRMMNGGLSDSRNTESNSNHNKLYSCIIHGTQRVKENNMIVLRLMEDLLTDDNHKIPKNTIIYGTLQRGGSDRVNIIVSSVKVGNNFHPFKARIYSADGLEGIRIAYTEVEQQVKNEAMNQASSALNSNLGKDMITKAISGVASVIVSSSSREKQLEVTMIENVKLFIKKQND